MPVATIAVLNPKGGSGKSTLAVNLATALHRRHSKGALLVDTDAPQRTASDWRARAGEAAGALPDVVQVESADVLVNGLPRLASGYAFAVVDGAGQLEGLTGAAVRCADVVLVPVRPSPVDLWAVGDLVDVIRARQEQSGGRPAAAFVVSQAVTGANISEMVGDALDTFGLPVLEARTGHRVAYAESMMQGRSVLDRSSSKAAGEVEALADELQSLLNNYSSP